MSRRWNWRYRLPVGLPPAAAPAGGGGLDWWQGWGGAHGQVNPSDLPAAGVRPTFQATRSLPREAVPWRPVARAPCSGPLRGGPWREPPPGQTWLASD